MSAMFRCKNSLGALALASIMSVSILSAVLAQEPPGGDVWNKLRGVQTVGNPTDLLRGPRVRKELAISDKQTRQIVEAFEPLLEVRGNFREAQNLSPEDRRKHIEEMGKKVAAAGKLVAE